MQFKAFEEGVEVNGRTVMALVAGLGKFREIGERSLAKHRIGKIKRKKFILDIDGWYSQQAWLDSFEEMSQMTGVGALYDIGYSIPSTAEFTPGINDINSAIRSIDYAYHLNHRKNGVCLFDTAAGILHEGIGHYGYDPVPKKSMIISVCENPYPCVFDRGIITAMARAFCSTAIVVHDDSRPCRLRGENSCTFNIYW